MRFLCPFRGPSLRGRIVACLLASLALLFGSCSRGRTAAGEEDAKTSHYQRRFLVGFSNGFSANSWRAEMLTSLKQEAEKHPELELIVLDGQGDLNKQTADLETLVARRVDAILLIPNSSQAVTPVLRRAVQKGIKVVHFNLPLEDPESYSVYVGPDERERGRRWAEWLVKRMGGTGTLIMLGGIPGNPGTTVALEGALDVLKATSVKVAAYRDAFWQEDRARSVMAELIAKHPRIDGIWTDGGQVAAGALKALLAAGRPLVPITGDDYNGLFKLYMSHRTNSEKFDFASISSPTWQSKVALLTALKLLRGEQVEKWVKIEPRMLTGKDAERYVKSEFSDSIFVDTDLPDSALKEIK